MITVSERAYINERAYIPEHLSHYVSAISRSEPFLIGDFVAYLAGTNLVFVGYPLGGNFTDAGMLAALEGAKTRFEPALISIVAPALPSTLEACSPSPTDAYYRLDLSDLRLPKKTRNMLARARREVSVGTGAFGSEHQRLIKDFIRARHLDDATRFIFKRIPEYAKCDTALVFEARTGRGELAAFDIAEFGARGYAFYMFNFRSRNFNIPGVSDLLLAQIVERARAEGKRYVNLGLGIDAGITFFKKKWGARPFLQHVTCVQETMSQSSWEEAFDQFSRL